MGVSENQGYLILGVLIIRILLLGYYNDLLEPEASSFFLLGVCRV